MALRQDRTPSVQLCRNFLSNCCAQGAICNFFHVVFVSGTQCPTVLLNFRSMFVASNDSCCEGVACRQALSPSSASSERSSCEMPLAARQVVKPHAGSLLSADDLVAYPVLPSGGALRVRFREDRASAAAEEFPTNLVYRTAGSARAFAARGPMGWMQHCRYYLDGCCLHGESCNYVHVVLKAGVSYPPVFVDALRLQHRIELLCSTRPDLEPLSDLEDARLTTLLQVFRQSPLRPSTNSPLLFGSSNAAGDNNSGDAFAFLEDQLRLLVDNDKTVPSRAVAKPPRAHHILPSDQHC